MSIGTSIADIDREWPAVQHHKVAAEEPYPDLSGLSDEELRTVIEILDKAKAANELEEGNAGQ